MKLENIELPSNRNFGFFFTVIFLIASAYFYHIGSDTYHYIFGTLSAVFLIITLTKADALLPLNKLWMRFGLLLGMVVSPIVMGVIFFGIFTPIAFLMRMAGRDELSLIFKKTNSHWKKREVGTQTETFNNQF